MYHSCRPARQRGECQRPPPGNVQPLHRDADDVIFLVGMRGFEPRASWSQITRIIPTISEQVRKEKKGDIVVLVLPMLDTRQGRDLTGTLIADMVLQLMSYVAQTEREYIRQRQAEGIAAAKARGVHLGRKPKHKPDNFADVFSAWESSEISARTASKRLDVDRKTFSKWISQSFAEKS